jgi:hypothetical protein
LGDTECAARLPYWIWWLAIFAVCCRMTDFAPLRPERRGSLEAAKDSNGPGAAIATLSRHPSTNRGRLLMSIPLGLMLFLVAVFFTFYVGYNPYMADLANPGVPDALFTLCMLAAFECLRYRDRWGFAFAMAMSSLVLYAGPVMLVLILGAAWIWRPIGRREVVSWGFLATGLLGIIATFYLVRGAIEGVLPVWIGMLDMEYVNDYLAPVSRWKSGLLFLGYFVLGSGGITVLGLFTAFRQGPWQRTVATVTVLYLLVVLLSGFKNLHYLGPLLPIPIVLFLASRRSHTKRGAWKSSLWAACSLLGCLVVCWPSERATFTLNRQLGMQTTFATDSYLTAVHWARLRYLLRSQGIMSWDCDQHSWVAYAEQDAELRDPRPLVITDGDPPTPEYRLVASRRVEGTDAIAKLYTRDLNLIHWLSTRRPLRPTERYPVLFSPLAEGVYSPHGNMLEDLQRFPSWRGEHGKR